ncbi:unnamed protein product [Chironomus riparius]|uniref:Uncharacterized protein n=1 Tax=Chironomus riparius TaxID=315576 RepID=A0A9N9S165_9DIPT|nr:unnamed protein product [Chironomus riparius]
MIRKICIIVGLLVACYGQDIAIASTAENPPPPPQLPPLPSLTNGNITEVEAKNFTRPDGFHGGPHGNHTGIGPNHNHTDMGPPKNSSNLNRPFLPPPNGPLPNSDIQRPPLGNGYEDSGKKSSKVPKSSKASKASKRPKSSKGSKSSKRTTKPGKKEKAGKKDPTTAVAS